MRRSTRTMRSTPGISRTSPGPFGRAGGRGGTRPRARTRAGCGRGGRQRPPRPGRHDEDQRDVTAVMASTPIPRRGGPTASARAPSTTTCSPSRGGGSSSSARAARAPQLAGDEHVAHRRDVVAHDADAADEPVGRPRARRGPPAPCGPRRARARATRPRPAARREPNEHAAPRGLDGRARRRWPARARRRRRARRTKPRAPRRRAARRRSPATRRSARSLARLLEPDGTPPHFPARWARCSSTSPAGWCC